MNRNSVLILIDEHHSENFHSWPNDW
jgi:hypothetical protein